MDIIFLVLLLIGVIMIVIAQVLKHKGMWNLKNDDAPFSNPRGIHSPYDLTTLGVLLFAMGIIGEIWNIFGIKAGLWSVVAAAAINAAANIIWLRYIEKDDEDPRTSAAVNILLSVFAIFIAGLMLFLIT